MAWNTQTITAEHPKGTPVAPEAGAFAFGAKLGFFGNNAPKWKILPPDTDSTNGNSYPEGWDDGDTGVPLGSSRTVWEDSQGNPIAPLAYLERIVALLKKQGNTAEARAELDELLRRAPGDPILIRVRRDL